MNETARYRVRLSVPRVGGMRAWGSAAGDFERRLAAQAGAMVSGPRIEGQSRRGRDYVRVTIEMTVTAEDIGQSVVIAWRAFRETAGDDLGGWDLAAASAEVSPA